VDRKKDEVEYPTRKGHVNKTSLKKPNKHAVTGRGQHMNGGKKKRKTMTKMQKNEQVKTGPYAVPSIGKRCINEKKKRGEKKLEQPC